MHESPFSRALEIQSHAQTVVKAMTVVSEMVKQNLAGINRAIQSHQLFVDLIGLAKKSPHPSTARPFPRPGRFVYLIDDCGRFIHIDGDAGCPTGAFFNPWQPICAELTVQADGTATMLKFTINFEALLASAIDSPSSPTHIDKVFP